MFVYAYILVENEVLPVQETDAKFPHLEDG